MNKILKLYKNLFKSSKNDFKIQSFTYFIPAPPQRSSGYREKQFDKLFYEYINKGYEIISFHSQACNNPNQSGMWIVCVVRALNHEASLLSLNDIFHDKVKASSEVKNEIDGLYYINEVESENI